MTRPGFRGSHSVLREVAGRLRTTASRSDIFAKLGALIGETLHHAFN